MRELLHCKLNLPFASPGRQDLCKGAGFRNLVCLNPSSNPHSHGVCRSSGDRAISMENNSCPTKGCKLGLRANGKESISFLCGAAHLGDGVESSSVNICLKTDFIGKHVHHNLFPERILEGARFCFDCMVHVVAEEAATPKALTPNHSNCSLNPQRFSSGYTELRFLPSFRPSVAYSFSSQSKQTRLVGFSDTASLRDVPTSHFGSKIRRRRQFRISAQKRSWWKEFLFGSITLEDFPSFDNSNPGSGASDELDWEDDVAGAVDETVDSNNKMDEVDRLLMDDEKFSSWKQETDAMREPKQKQNRGKDFPRNNWEDWLDDSSKDYNELHPGKDSWYQPQSEWEKGGLPRSPPKIPERGMNRTVKDLFLRFFEKQEEVEEDLTFEERVFIFTTQSTAKFVACLVLVPWFVAFVVHDYAVVPFLNRYVEKVPLAAKALDVRESQKLKIIEKLKLERQRVRLEAAIGKAPPLTDEELTEHIRDEARKLQEEFRAENRNAFGNIWSDLMAGAALLFLLVFNPNQVAIMKLTGDRVSTNISDTGKAFIIILLSDIFLGYHSESGWETVIEIFLEHYGFEVDQASIYVFVAIVPVTIDACFKLWVFRYLTRLSASAASTFRAMKRH